MSRIDINKVVSEISGISPDLTSEQKKVSLLIYRHLALGKPVEIGTLSSSLEMSEGSVKKIIDNWTGIYFDEKEHIIGYWGLTLKETPHRFNVGGNRLYTWCAWDSLFIPQILQTEAQIETTCPITQERIKLLVSPDRFDSQSHPNIAMSFLSLSEFGKDIISKFCHYIYFFKTSKDAETWCTKNKDTFSISLFDAYLIACKRNENVYGKQLLNIKYNAKES